jgi:hypothetical protein
MSVVDDRRQERIDNPLVLPTDQHHTCVLQDVYGERVHVVLGMLFLRSQIEASGKRDDCLVLALADRLADREFFRILELPRFDGRVGA